MSITKRDGVLADEISRLSELACDEALFGVPPTHARELDESGSEVAVLRRQLALVTSGLALREVGQHEPLPAGLRSKLQAQAFSHFERRGSAPPIPTATTTGANVVELASPATAPPQRSRPWLSSLALAACFAAITGTVVWRFTREGAPPANATADRREVPEEVGPPFSAPLQASRAGARAVLAWSDEPAQVTFSLVGAADLQMQDGTALWLHVEQPSGTVWRRVATIVPSSDGSLRLTFAPSDMRRILGFALTTSLPTDSTAPDLRHAQLEARVSE